MGARKHIYAQELKEDRKSQFAARLNNYPTSPRKMRLVADLVRGKNVDTALEILKYHPKEPSRPLEKVVLSAISNWQQKNEGARLEDAGLFIKEIFVDSARQLKRFRPAPHGRAHRIRKRSNHVTVILGTTVAPEMKEQALEAKTEVVKEEAVTENQQTDGK